LIPPERIESLVSSQAFFYLIVGLGIKIGYYVGEDLEW
jgi:hypothetical protein